MYLEREGFSIENVEVGGRRGFFIGGAVETTHAKWAAIVERWVDGSELASSLGNTTAAGVLLLPTAVQANLAEFGPSPSAWVFI